MTAREFDLHLIDAFADGAFTGNPAAVVLLDAPPHDRWMQQLAMEMNQAETAFLVRRDDGYSLRWFTPRSEVDLCGHATLASAHYLWELHHLGAAAPARFHTRSGVLTATKSPDDSITLDFPAIVSRPVAPPADLEGALGTSVREIVGGDFDLLCLLESADQVRRIAPDLGAIARWKTRGVVVTAPGDRAGIDFVSRCFFPALGVPEDPVTGSAHCALVPYWNKRLGKTALTGYQASARGGTLRCELRGDRVILTGRAITTMRGKVSGSL